MAELEKRLLGFDLPNGYSYIGMTNQLVSNSIFILENYIVEPTANIGSLEDTYSSSRSRNRFGGQVRIEMGPGIAMRLPQDDQKEE